MEFLVSISRISHDILWKNSEAGESRTNNIMKQCIGMNSCYFLQLAPGHLIRVWIYSEVLNRTVFLRWHSVKACVCRPRWRVDVRLLNGQRLALVCATFSPPLAHQPIRPPESIIIYSTVPVRNVSMFSNIHFIPTILFIYVIQRE